MDILNKKIYILSPYPHGTAPSQRFRYEQYIEELKKQGFQIELHPFIDNKGWDVLYKNGLMFQKIIIMMTGFLRRFRLLFIIKKTDYIFVHREMAHFGPPVFEFLTAKLLRIKYIYDFDDAIWIPNYSESNAKFQWIKCFWKVKYLIRWASTVTVGNQYLADYAKKYNQNVIVIPTTIDMENHHNETIDYQNEKICIGWTGSHSTMHYLNAIVDVIKKLETKFDFSFVIISDKKPDFETESLKFIKWNKETEIQDLSTFSIGIMPLVEDQWSKGKCGFKALQYMSLGIPSVLSPIGVNLDIIKNGENGFLADTNEDFYCHLKQLIENKETRKKIGLEGKATVKARYSVNANLPKYLNLFDKH